MNSSIPVHIVPDHTQEETMKTRTTRMKRLALIGMPLAGILAAASPAQAVEVGGVEFGGYFRATPSSDGTEKHRACYGLAGPGLKYRLGNECDNYGELFVSKEMDVGGIQLKGLVMAVASEQIAVDGDGQLDMNQMYLEAKGFGFSPETSFWIGKRFYGRADVHIVDTKFTVLDGLGAGVKDIAAGPGKLAFSYFAEDLDDNVSGNRLNAEFYDLPVNPGGKLRLVATLADGDARNGGKSGGALTLQHNQGNFQGEGGGNSLWLQYAEGGAALDGNFANLVTGDDIKSWRVAESYHWQKGNFGGQALAMYQYDDSKLSGNSHSVSVGGRISYALTDNFKLVSELGHSQKKPDSGDTARLTKFTFAPTLSLGRGFLSRPELRVFVTTAKWNSAAGNVTGLAALDGKTSGTSYGIQLEHWF